MLLCEEVIIPFDRDLGTKDHGNFDRIKFVSTLLTGHMADIGFHVEFSHRKYTVGTMYKKCIVQESTENVQWKRCTDNV